MQLKYQNSGCLFYFMQVFFYFAPPKVMRKHLENVCLQFFFLLKNPQQTNQQKESLPCSLKQQMLPLTLGFKGTSILVYMS